MAIELPVLSHSHATLVLNGPTQCNNTSSLQPHPRQNRKRKAGYTANNTGY